MRIRYLSLSTAHYAANYFPFLRDYLQSVASPGTEIEIEGTRVGRIDSYRFFEHLDSISILNSVLDAEQSGFDAVIIGNFLDPALREARSMVDIPVVGLGETSMLTSCMMGNKFALITVNPHFSPRFEENIAKYGLKDRLAGIKFMNLTPHELDRSFSEEEYHQRAMDEFTAASRELISNGADVLIPAGGRLMAFLNANGIRTIDDAQILDGPATVLAMAEAAMKVRAASGSFVSRQGLYGKAPDALIRSAAGEYADGYQMPALGKLGGMDDDTSNG